MSNTDLKHQVRHLRFKERLGEKNEQGCMEWQGSFAPNKEYGQFWWGGGTGEPDNISAHRAAWILEHGPIPKGMQVLHKCNNPPCCNAKDAGHLYLGTHAQNMKDREDSGHTSRWDHRYNFKRSDELIEKISVEVKSGKQLADVCKTLGIGWQTLYRARAQSEALEALIRETKKARYSVGAKKRWQ